MIKRFTGLLVLVLVVAALYFANYFLLSWWTDDPRIVLQDSAVSEQPIPAPVDNGFGEVLDEGTANENSNRNSRRVANEVLSRWAMQVTLLTALLGLLWFGIAWVRERRVFGPAGQSSLLPAWAFLLFLYAAGALGLYYLYVVPANLFRLIETGDIYGPAGIVGVLGAVAFWTISIFAIAPQLRPSVVGGATFS